MSRVALVHPPNVYSRKGVLLISIPPIGLAYVAAAIEQAGHQVQVIDAVGHFAGHDYRIEFADREYFVNGARPSEICDALDPETEVVGLTCMFMHHWPMVRLVMREIRARFPEVTIVVGGEHVTGAPEYSLRDSCADALVLGEGEETFCDLLEALAGGRDLATVEGIAYLRGDEVVVTPRRKRIRALGALPRPAWHLFPVQTYMDRKMFHGPSVGRSMPILATRGCPYQCTFCTSPNMWTTRYVTRDVKDVVDEMAEYRERYGACDFQFVDLTAVVKRQWILDFCAELASRAWPEVRWQLPSGTRSEAIDFEVASAMKRSGCHILTYAPESGSEAMLARIKKRVDTDRMIASIRAVRRAGLAVECFTIVGFPDETRREMLQTLGFIARLALVGVESVPISGYRPVPGTEISASLLATGQIVYSDAVFMDLVESATILGGRSYNPRFTDAQIGLVRLIGYLWFFAISFLVRPWRLVRVLANVARNNQTTKLEKALREQLERRRKLGRLEAEPDYASRPGRTSSRPEAVARGPRGSAARISR